MSSVRIKLNRIKRNEKNNWTLLVRNHRNKSLNVLKKINCRERLTFKDLFRISQSLKTQKFVPLQVPKPGRTFAKVQQYCLSRISWSDSGLKLFNGELSILNLSRAIYLDWWSSAKMTALLISVLISYWQDTAAHINFIRLASFTSCYFNNWTLLALELISMQLYQPSFRSGL